MKHIAVFLISVYQYVFSPLIRTLCGQHTVCRYEKSCSAYAKEQIQLRGVVVGSVVSMKRLLSCQPFAKGEFT